MIRESSWNAYGPFYATSALEKCGIPVTGDLISFATKDGSRLYPQGQFDVDDYGFTILGIREPVIKMYDDLLLPPVTSGEISELEAIHLIIQPNKNAPSRADTIADPNTSGETLNAIAQAITRTLSNWRTGSY